LPSTAASDSPVKLEAGKPTAQLGKALATARAVGLHLTVNDTAQG
jgi:hypothetical protein